MVYSQGRWALSRLDDLEADAEVGRELKWEGRDALKSGKWSDLKLIVDDQVFLVHRAAVCSKSPVLARAVSEKFQVSQACQTSPCSSKLCLV